MTFLATRSVAIILIRNLLYVTDMVWRSRVQPPLLGEGRPDTRELRKSSLHVGLASSHGLVLYIGITFPPWTELSKKNYSDYNDYSIVCR